MTNQSTQTKSGLFVRTPQQTVPAQSKSAVPTQSKCYPHTIKFNLHVK